MILDELDFPDMHIILPESGRDLRLELKKRFAVNGETGIEIIRIVARE
jgi:hypothetical protein